MIKLSVVLLLAVGCCCRFRPDLFEEGFPELASPSLQVDLTSQTQFWFDQFVDHYDYSSKATWKQRYWVLDNHFNPKNGSVILYICGEWVCSGITAGLGGVTEIANATNSLIVTLEHRFYGQSMPFGNDSLNLANLKYLNTEQALKDLAYFITQFKAKNDYGVTNNPWISVGGSYPGAMTAWFRYKYPHLTIGSLSSSGVVNAIEDFTAFDESIYTSTLKSSKTCAATIQKLSAYVESQLTTNATAFKAVFKADKLSTEEFLLYWSDVIVFQVQYGKRTDLCDKLKNLTIFDDQFKVIRLDALKIDPREYSSYHLQDPTYYNTDGQVSRAWNYQVCSEFGWFQTFSTNHAMRSKKVNIDFFRNFCQATYAIAPNVQLSNTEFGALETTSTNLYMINADEDPWQWASLRKNRGSLTAVTISCTNCAHCIDLHTPSTNDPKPLTKARANRLLTVKGWIA